MKKTLCLLALLWATPSPAQVNLTMGIAAMLAVEEGCELDYDVAAVSDFIDLAIPKEDVSFSGRLEIMIEGYKTMFYALPSSSRERVCASAKSAARDLEFIGPDS